MEDRWSEDSERKSRSRHRRKKGGDEGWGKSGWKSGVLRWTGGVGGGGAGLAVWF